MSKQWKLVNVEPTQAMLDAMTTERKKGNGVLQMWFEAFAAAPTAHAVSNTVQRFWTEEAKNIRCVREADFDACVSRLQAENAALQQRLNTADQRVDDLQKDKERLDALEANYWDVRHHSSALGDTGDYTSSVEIIGHWMDKPHERVIGENYNENLRAAIDQAMTADAYPPARPEYPELDAALAEKDWHMNPCKQGHRDVGACQGKAFCHTCDETITAETTQQAFEQWNATHPAVPQ